MYQTGALIVESSKLLLPALAAASRVVSGVLYIPLDYESPPGDDLHLPHEETKHLLVASQQIKRIYFEASRYSPLLDVRILLPPLPLHCHPSVPPLTAKDDHLLPSLQYDNLDVVLSSLPTLDDVKSSPGYRLLAKRVKVDLEMRFKKLDVRIILHIILIAVITIP